MTDKKSKFRRLAEARVTETIEWIRKIGNLSNPYIYEYTESEVDQIFTRLRSEIDEAEHLFKKERVRQRVKFVLDGGAGE